jgi:hypothetical protein
MGQRSRRRRMPDALGQRRGGRSWRCRSLSPYPVLAKFFDPALVSQVLSQTVVNGLPQYDQPIPSLDMGLGKLAPAGKLPLNGAAASRPILRSQEGFTSPIL